MTNRISKVKDFVDHNAVKNNISNITNNDIRQTEFLFDYSLLTIENEDKDKLRKHEKSLLFHRKQINKATADMGRVLTEARDVFIKSHSESFVEWYERLGFSKDQVSVAMNRYQLTVEYPDLRDNIINLSDIAIKEVVNKKTPNSIKEKVLAGQITTGQQIRAERKNSSIAVEKFSKVESKNNSIAIEKFEEVEEAEIIESDENKVSLSNFILGKQSILISLEEAFKNVKNGANTPENLEIFLKVQELLEKIK